MNQGTGKADALQSVFPDPDDSLLEPDLILILRIRTRGWKPLGRL